MISKLHRPRPRYEPFLDRSHYMSHDEPQRLLTCNASSLLYRIAEDERLLLGAISKLESVDVDLENPPYYLAHAAGLREDNGPPFDLTPYEKALIARLYEMLFQVKAFGECDGDQIGETISKVCRHIRSGRVEIFPGNFRKTPPPK